MYKKVSHVEDSSTIDEIRLTVSIGDKDLPHTVFNRTLTNVINSECPTCANDDLRGFVLEIGRTNENSNDKETICYCWDCNEFIAWSDTKPKLQDKEIPYEDETPIMPSPIFENR